MVKSIKGPDSNVRDLIPILRLEIRDLDGVAKATGIDNGDLLPVTIFKTEGTTSQMAVVDLLEAEALRLAKKGKIKIGWTSSRVRLRTNARHCFIFLGYGHSQYVCKGPDRSKTCLKCVEDGHKRTECSKVKPKCFLFKTRKDKCSTEHYRGEGN